MGPCVQTGRHHSPQFWKSHLGLIDVSCFAQGQKAGARPGGSQDPVTSTGSSQQSLLEILLIPLSGNALRWLLICLASRSLGPSGIGVRPPLLLTSFPRDSPSHGPTHRFFVAQTFVQSSGPVCPLVYPASSSGWLMGALNSISLYLCCPSSFC